MPIYAKKTTSTHPRFSGRHIQVIAASPSCGIGVSVIQVPDTEVICNGCNTNVYPLDGYLVYLGKRELQKDQPYDFYCSECQKKYFPKAVIV